jgi:hypothetical protein
LLPVASSWASRPRATTTNLDLGGLLAIEYAYHVSLMVAGVIAAAWFITVVRPHRTDAASV